MKKKLTLTVEDFLIGRARRNRLNLSKLLEAAIRFRLSDENIDSMVVEAHD